jgi:hypothetical protein
MYVPCYPRVAEPRLEVHAVFGSLPDHSHPHFPALFAVVATGMDRGPLIGVVFLFGFLALAEVA